MKKSISFPVTEPDIIKIQMLNWVNRFSIFCFLDNQKYDFSKPAFECLLAAGSKRYVQADAGNALHQLRDFYNRQQGEWLFGHLGYDLKNEIEPLRSGHSDRVGFSDLFFFVPEYVIKLDDDLLTVFGEGDLNAVYHDICSSPSEIKAERIQAEIKQRIGKEEYHQVITELRDHILRGDCYEVNFCQEFFAENVSIPPLQTYWRLSTISPNPFSAYYRVNEQYCFCASPERYLKKTGSHVFSQPIKGTSRRFLTDKAEDELTRQYLLHSEKERSENVMVVDIVRNDLSRVCKPGSVKVDELFGVYSFPQVHQMISTVSGELAGEMDWVDCIKATFPMGSMTGAPKKKVMELIEKYEHSRRGLFSGAIGYIDPDANADFNVVIRSILYNASNSYLSFQTGGGITYKSIPEKEYEESLLKAEAMKKIFE